MSNEIPSGPIYTVVDPQVNSNAECEVCQFIIQYLEKSMSSRKSKDELENLFHGVCKHLPSRMSAKCNTFVDEYAEVVIELLLQEVSPKEICTVVNLCKTETTETTEIRGIATTESNTYSNDELKEMARMNSFPSVVLV